MEQEYAVFHCFTHTSKLFVVLLSCQGFGNAVYSITMIVAKECLLVLFLTVYFRLWSLLHLLLLRVSGLPTIVLVEDALGSCLNALRLLLVWSLERLS